MKKEFIDLKEFIPNKVLVGKKPNKSDLNIEIKENDIKLFYSTLHSNNSKRKHHLIIPRYIKNNKETFEVLGLLQAEMRKTYDGAVSFTNHEYRLVNNVMLWFKKEFDINFGWWKWHLTVNINKPEDENYKKEIEAKLLQYWIKKSPVLKENANPVSVIYIKNTKNKKLKFYDHGSLNIYYKSNLLSQIIKKYVKEMSFLVPTLDRENIRNFMKGIIAGEGCVENEKKWGHFRVHISAKDKEDRDLYQNCLNKIGIKIVQYHNYTEMIISKRENHIKLLKQKLMCLSPKKYNKFLSMLNNYDSFPELEEWRKNQIKPHNKIHQDKVKKILKIHNQNPNLPTLKIAELLGISQIKIQRTLKENNLGKRLIKTPEEKRLQIANYAKQNQHLRQYEIADQFKVHESVVRRAISRYR